MSAADDAWRAWSAERTGIAQSQRGIEISRAAFLAGYRQALEDAANAAEANAHPWVALYLRARAAADPENDDWGSHPETLQAEHNAAADPADLDDAKGIEDYSLDGEL